MVNGYSYLNPLWDWIAAYKINIILIKKNTDKTPIDLIKEK